MKRSTKTPSSIGGIRLASKTFKATERSTWLLCGWLQSILLHSERVAESLSQLTKPGGRVVVYTINRWSAVSVITWLTPFKLHHPIKSLLWGSEEKDTFPVTYRMNTRGALVRLFQRSGFREQYFTYLDDCRSLSRFRATQVCELYSWRVMRALGWRYPENCILGIYERL